MITGITGGHTGVTATYARFLIDDIESTIFITGKTDNGKVETAEFKIEGDMYLFIVDRRKSDSHKLRLSSNNYYLNSKEEEPKSFWEKLDDLFE